MIHKSTILGCSDNSGVVTVNCFHIYQKKKNQIAFFSNLIKISTRNVYLRSIKLKKKKFKAIVILTKFRNKKIDGSYIFFKNNNCIILKRRIIALSNLITGCCLYNLKRKKFLSSFSIII